MFQPKVLRFLSNMAMFICIIFSILSFYLASEGGTSYLYPVTWIILSYGSYCASKLVDYDIYDEDFTKIGWAIYLFYVIFILSIFAGLFFGIGLTLVVTIWLHRLKISRENEESENNDLAENE